MRRFLPFPYAQRLFILLLCAWLLALRPGHAQAVFTDASLKYTPAQPPAPEAAALGKFGQTPVSLYTGIPQISIPIYVLRLPGLEVPISLDYHAGGIRASETASNVGLGWALQAGGLISSTINGLADFSLRGYARGTGLIPTSRFLRPVIDLHTGVTNADYEFMMRATACPRVNYDPSIGGVTTTSAPAYGYDTQPDVFQYNFAGRSGQFFHTQDGVAHPMPYEPLAITRILPDSLSSWEEGKGYQITDEKGTVYTFNQLEVTATTIIKLGAAANPTDELNPHSLVYHLSRIQTVRGDVVSFTYDTLTSRYQNVTSRTRFLKLPGNTCNPRPDASTQSFSVTKGLVIKKITSSLGPVVHFEYASCRRLDLTGSRALTAIVVQEGDQTRRFILQQGYFNGPTSLCDLPVGLPDYAQVPDLYRLQLLGVQEVGKPAYRLLYHPAPVPPRLQAREDHWGFINGQGGGDFPLDLANGFRNGYSRDPDSTAMLGGMLQEIHYPTGGYTRFQFEPNGHPITGDSTVTELAKSVAFYADDSVAYTYRKHTTFRLKTANTASVHADFDTPDCNQSTAQFTATISAGGTQVAEYCGQSSTLGTSHDPPMGYNSYMDYAVDIYKVGDCEGSYFRLNWVEPVTVARRGRSEFTGGLRIREVLDYDGVHAAPASRQRYFYTALDTTRSSGVTLGPIPTYTSQIAEPIPVDPHHPTQPIDPTNIGVACHWLMQTTTTQIPLGSIKGNNMAYTSVLVLADKQGQQGLTQHKFSFANDYNPYAGYPYTQATSYDWARGLPLERTEFAYDATQHWFHPLKRVRTHFTSRFTPPLAFGEDSTNYTPPGQPNEAHAIGLNLLVASPQYVVSASGPYPYISATFYNQAYKLLSVWQYKDKEQTFVFDPTDSTKYTISTTTYQYRNPQHAQVTASTTSLTGRDSLMTRFVYPLDFDTASVQMPATQAIRFLARTHQLGIALETQHLRYRPMTGFRVVGGELLEYAGQWPRRVRALVTTAPLPDSTSQAVVRGGALMANFHYQDVLWLDRYDRRGNVVEEHRVAGSPSAFLWNAATGEPVARAQRSTYAQVAATSFEPAATGRWRYDSVGTHRVLGGRTGRWAYQLDGQAPVTRSALPAGDYELTYWVQSSRSPDCTLAGGALVGSGPQVVATASGGWNQYYSRVRLVTTGQVSLDVANGSGSLRLDELRLYPLGAQLTSYTYEPLVGVTSQTDPTGRTTTYEYDTLGRLLRTRDEQGRILSQQQYHYAGK